MNAEQNDHIDAALDRAARQLVEHDPPQRMYGAVMSAVRGTERRRPRKWFTWLVAATAAAVVIVALAIWPRPDAPVVTVEAPAVRTPPEAPIGIEPQTWRAAVPSRTGRTPLPRRPPPSTEPQTSELAAAISDVRVREIAISNVPITTIDLEPVGFDPIHISDISLEPQ